MREPTELKYQGPLFYFCVGIAWTLLAEAMIWVAFIREVL